MKKLIFTLSLFTALLSALLQISIPTTLKAQNWTPTTGLDNKIVFSMTQCGNTLFAGVGVSFLINGSLHKSTDAGQNWTQIDLGTDPSAIMSMAAKDSFVFAGSYQNHLYLSSNRGLTWTNVQINSGFGTGIFEIGVSGNNIFCYVNTINPYYISTNNGYNWSPVVSSALNGNINGLINKDDKFFAATRKGMAYSTDHGFTWVRPNNYGLPGNPDSTRPLSCLTSLGNRIYTSCINKILYTDDNGESWIESNINLGNFPNMNSMVSTTTFVPRIFASMSGQADTTRGVRVSTNNGTTWNLGNQGFPASTGVMALMIDATNNILFAGTNGKGVYRTFLSSIQAVTEPGIANEFSLKQNFPNPFNPVTRISYELRNAAEVSLKVYDVKGNEVEILVNERQGVGSYTVSFSAGNYPSGVYFYKLEAGNLTETRKMLLVK